MSVVHIIASGLALGIVAPAAYIDLKTKRIPNKLLLICLVPVLVFIVSVCFTDFTEAPNYLADKALGVLAGGGIILALHIFTRGGIGGGDVKLLALLGLLLGLNPSLVIIVTTMGLFALVALVLLVARRVKRMDTLPLAPFILVGVIVQCALTLVRGIGFLL